VVFPGNGDNIVFIDCDHDFVAFAHRIDVAQKAEFIWLLEASFT
jgi:hypothetical protein